MTSPSSPFLAILSRLKYIDRWALMRNAHDENLSEHTCDVALIAHMLATIAHVRYGRKVSPDRAAVVALYHDVNEIITGDLPTPVKYANPQIKDAYKALESEAQQTLIKTLPLDLQDSFQTVFTPDASCPEEHDDIYLFALVKAADKISALIKCIEERNAGNTEFTQAEQSTRESLERYVEAYPEVRDFMESFLSGYGKTLDELLGK